MERLKSITIIFSLAVGLLTSVAPAKTVSVLLQEGLYAEEIEGDLDAAIKIYKQVISESKEAQRAGAQATYRIGMCYLKKGEKAKAAEQFQNLISKYPEQKTLVTRSREHLTKLVPPAVGGFGPVMERVINDDGEEKHWLIDFDTGSLFSHSIEIRSEEAILRWCAENRIDAMGDTRASGPGLYGIDMAVIPIDAETWKTISPKELVDDLSIAKGGTPAFMSAAGKLPVTYIFKTREGGMGIVQILEMQHNKKPRHFRIRYKILQQKLNEIETLIKEMHNPDAPRFVALNKLIEIGAPAVEPLISELQKSNDWQVPKALGAIKDKRAVEPLIKKWQKCDWSPMKEVISEALEKITGMKLGQDKQKWDKWWQETKRFISPEATIRNFMAAAMKLDMNNAMVCVAGDSHDYKDIKAVFEKPEHPFNMLFRKIDPSVPVKILETKIIENMCEAVWQVTFKEDFTIEGKTFKAGETFDIDGNLRRHGDKWLITGI